ncbi:MAG: ChaN family lipoprotein [Planctomycetota bacterium]
MRRGLLCCALAAACSSTQTEPPGTPPPPPVRHPPPLQPQEGRDEIHRTSRETSFQEMVAELARVDVVYVGATHDNAEHHRIQLRILEEMFDRKRLHGIGMEMFQRRFQPALDDYVGGRIDEAELLERTEYRKRWGFDFALYRPILEFARRWRIPIIALNVENEIRRKVSQGGLVAVPDEPRKDLPAIYTDDPAHRAFVWDIFLKMHQDISEKDPKLKDLGEAARQRELERRFGNFYLVMCLWDDVMADGVFRWFRTAPRDGQLVVLAGSGHLANRYGIPGRAHRRNGRPHAIVIPVAVGEDPPSAEKFARRYADFVWLTGPGGSKVERNLAGLSAAR